MDIKTITLNIFVLYLSINSVFAAKHQLALNLEKKINLQAKSISDVVGHIKSLESGLENQNSKIINIIKLKKNIETQLSIIVKNQSQYEIEIQSNKVLLKKSLIGYVLNSFEKGESAVQILSENILIKNIKKKIKRLNHFSKKVAINVVKTKTLNKRYRLFLENERDLASLSKTLEMKKKHYAEIFLTQNKQINKLKSKLKKIKRKKIKKISKTYNKIKGGLFISPIPHHLDIEYARKGVTFKFNRQMPVFSTKAGKVVHVGKLSQFGNVIMIDHGHDLRSIILGEFTPKVKKGKRMKQGDVIGYTIRSKSKKLSMNKIYFEIRKKNKVRNTILFIDKKTLASNN